MRHVKTVEATSDGAARVRALFERVVSLRLSSKKMKFFFTRYLAYAREVDDGELIDHVKERARHWVAQHAGGADDDNDA